MTGLSQPAQGPSQFDAWNQYYAASQPPAVKPLSKAAVASLVFGIIGGFPLAYVFGIVGLAVTGRNGTRRGRGLAVAGVVLATLWLAAVVAITVYAVQRQPDRDSSGRVSGAGTSDVFDLRAGDCLRDPAADGGKVTEAAVVPCSQPHLGQIVVEVPLTGTTYDAGAIQAEAERQCGSLAPKALTSDAPTSLQLFYLVPDRTAWDRDASHTASCVISSDTALTKSYVTGS